MERGRGAAGWAEDRSATLPRTDGVNASRLRPRRSVLPSLLVVFLLPAAAAHAGGLPATALDAGQEGVRDRDGDHRFTAVPLATRTVVTKSQTQGGRVLRASILDGRWGVPVVADDGTSGGLSADGRTLVLTRVADAFPRRHTGFAVIGTASMAVQDTVELDGDWRFDALSPHGRWLYLVQHPESAGGALRTYDLAKRRLLAPAEPIRGRPVARATAPAGRWEYTLYDGPERVFVHARDTARRTSLALELPPRVARHRRIWAMRLAVRRGRIEVLQGDQIVASAARRPRRASVGGGAPWLAVAVVFAGLFAAAAGARRAQATSRRRRELRNPYTA
jgi:hypothetical protein